MSGTVRALRPTTALKRCPDGVGWAGTMMRRLPSLGRAIQAGTRNGARRLPHCSYRIQSGSRRRATGDSSRIPRGRKPVYHGLESASIRVPADATLATAIQGRGRKEKNLPRVAAHRFIAWRILCRCQESFWRMGISEPQSCFPFFSLCSSVRYLDCPRSSFVCPKISFGAKQKCDPFDNAVRCQKNNLDLG